MREKRIVLDSCLSWSLILWWGIDEKLPLDQVGCVHPLCPQLPAAVNKCYSIWQLRRSRCHTWLLSMWGAECKWPHFSFIPSLIIKPQTDGISMSGAFNKIKRPKFPVRRNRVVWWDGSVGKTTGQVSLNPTRGEKKNHSSGVLSLFPLY